MKPDNVDQIRRQVLNRLESLEQSGVSQLPRKAAARKQSRAGAVGEPQSVPTERAQSAPPPAQSVAAKEPELKLPGWQASERDLFHDDAASREVAAASTLSVLQPMVAACTRCEELARTRTQTVFGVGNPKARLCFLGEAPGADEDRLGEPFVGRGGQLLNKILEACRLSRDDVYILNMIKCRPPGNRNPLPEELTNCRGFLERQFDLIKPEFICCLGAVASQNLLRTTIAIGKLRGKLHAYRGAKVVCTYHPAFLLRSPSFKKETWEDMKLLMREMGVEL
jgi:uracil-DNA glycosylase